MDYVFVFSITYQLINKMNCHCTHKKWMTTEFNKNKSGLETNVICIILYVINMYL